MSDKEDYLTSYREFFENFAATVNPEDQLPVNIAGYTITEAELPGEVIYWTTQYLAEKQCPLTLMTPLRRIILDEVRIASKKQPNDFGYRADDSVYIALRLMQAVTARVNDVCLRYLDNSRLDTLPPPPPVKELKTVSIATKNSRRVMEDRHTEIGNLEALFGIETTEPTCFYAVYDGHAGSAAATYCAAHLHQYLVESPLFGADLRGALRDAFLRTDHDFVRKSHQERAAGGSTAVAVAVRGRRLLCAWAGDSLALLAKRMRLMQLVTPHKPGREDERERIEQQGGTVMYWGTWRVNGQLAVSRAIGDAQYKPYVTARPETTAVNLDGDEDFVVVACDGLWDFVSEDDVALTVYRQIAADPDDLKAVTKRLVLQAKRQGSADNISIIVVFLKEPRDIAADNRCPPMDLGLDNALANVPPFVMDTEACKRADGAPAEADADAECEAEAEAAPDNGVEHSDSDSEDLGPETAVDIDADVDDFDAERHNPQPPTPPAHAVEENHVDVGLADNVAESGEESEDEWNYFQGSGGRSDPAPRPGTPPNDNLSDSSSVDMNSSPLNPDAPVFVPGGADVVLAQSPRKPVPMDDIELPDSSQFSTEAHVRPAELLDLDNCDQLNGHHNVLLDESKEHMNGNEKSALDSLGFGFGAGADADAGTGTGTGAGADPLIHDFERIQKDTTDFCNIQVFQTHTETNPFTAGEGNEELFERLKNKERDPMSMSFYQEKDDDTCERLAPERVDLNAVQPLPDSDEEESANGDGDSEKENVSPAAGPATGDLLGGLPGLPEPDNDVLRFDNDNAASFARSENIFDPPTNMQAFAMEFDSEHREELAHTDTPESHKLLFEQIPEIPDGKNSELGFAADDPHPRDPESDNARVISPQEEPSQDVDMDSKPDSPLEEARPEITPEPEIGFAEDSANEIAAEFESQLKLEPSPAASPAPPSPAASPTPVASPAPAPAPREPVTPEQSDVHHNIIADVHQDSQPHDGFPEDTFEPREQVSQTQFEAQPAPAAASPAPASPAFSPPPSESPAPALVETAPSPAPAHSPLPQELPPSPVPFAASPVPAPADVPLPRESPIPDAVLRPETASPAAASPLPADEPSFQAASPAPICRLPKLQDRLSPEPAPQAEAAEPSGPAPDIVPEQPRAELVTDIDIGIPESRAQEICVPVTSELREVSELATHTPPPTPAAEPAAPPEVAPLIAADAAPRPDESDDKTVLATAAAAAATAAVAATAVAATVSKTKTPSTAAKKSPTTPKPAPTKAAPKTPTARTPISAKKPAAATPAAKTPVTKTTPARTPLAAKPATPKTPVSAPKQAPAKPAPAKTSTVAPKPAPVPKPAAPRSAPAPRPAPAPARPAVRETVPKPAPARTAAAKPAPRPAPARPATAGPRPATTAAATAAARPASARPAPRPKPLEKKPLTNGDAKPSEVKKLPAGRPAPRPTPRAPLAAPAAAKPAAPAAPKPLPRSTARPAAAPADKQSKDLANRRITAKAAPPRTSAPKFQLPPGTKPPPIKAPKKVVVEPVKEPVTNGLTNGTGADAGAGDAGAGAADLGALAKPPPSPPPADNALLPDVIA